MVLNKQRQLHRDIKTHRQKITKQANGKITDPLEIIHKLRHDRINHIISLGQDTP